MSDATPIDEALDGLSELAACDLRLAKRFCARIEALPEDADERANNLARSYQRMARSYRQSVALQLRFRRELKAEANAEATDERKARSAEIFNRKAALKARLRTLIYDECEFERAELLDEVLLELLDHAAAQDDFLETPAAIHVATLSQALALGPHAPGPATRAEAPPPAEPVLNSS